jgi:hypothetical protein
MLQKRVGILCVLVSLVALATVPVTASAVTAKKLSCKCTQVTVYAYVPMAPLTLKPTGGTGPYTFTASGLPTGLSMSSSGTISGTPTVQGVFYYKVTVTDSTGATFTFQCDIIVCPPKITLMCPTSKAQIGVPYSSDLAAMGGLAPYTYSISGGTLPPGLTLDPSTGAVTGTPTTAGTYGYDGNAVDSAGDKVNTYCSIKVTAPVLGLSCASSTAQVGTPYSSALVPSGGKSPYTYSISSGALPPGLLLNASTGAITGTPTTSGTYHYTGKVVDASSAKATATCSIVVSSGTTSLTLSCPSSTATLNAAYTSALVAGGGTPAYTYSISGGALPTGLLLNTSTGAITGTPTASVTFTGKVVDSTGANTTAACTIDVSVPLSISCASSSAQVGLAYSSALAASGGTPAYTYSISVGSLPPGLSLNTSTGAITGTPTTGGTYNYTGKVVDSTGANATAACSISPITVGSCLPSSSLALLAQGSKVTSYVPNGSWSTATTGVQEVPIEPVGTPASITTPNVVNSCSSNSATGQTVCTANNTDVYLITGSTLNTTLTSGANTVADFSGGYCENCGVAINSTTNTAVITIGLSTASSGSGLQFLDLGSNTFATPVPALHEVSEDVLWDQSRNLILSPNEDSNYDLFQVGTSSTTEFANATAYTGEGDSAAEDCSTGIALSTLEFTDSLYISDLTQATFTPGPPGTWTAPGQVVAFPEFVGFAAGTDGIAVAGNSHLGIVSGEFGGNEFGAFQLPATSGTGTPSFLDYAAAALPNTPDGNAWEQGLDPHTITAYVSPNNGKAYGVMANGDGVPPTYLAIIDLQALLNAPRTTGTHTVDPTYDLIANGVVTYIATH